MTIINFTYDDCPTVAAWSLDREPMLRGLLGPFGCLAAETLVVTERGAIPISQLDGSVHVLTWDERAKRFRLAEATAAYPKGRGYLVRVSTPQGEFVAAENHRLLCSDGIYRQVRDLHSGSELFRSMSSEDVRRYLERLADFQTSCEGADRPCDQPLPTAEGAAATSFPSASDARRSGEPRPCRSGGERRDGLPAQGSGHTRRVGLFARKRIGDFVRQAAHRLLAWAHRGESLLFAHSAATALPALQSQPRIADRRTGEVSFSCSRTDYQALSTSSSPKRTILSLTREPVEREYWDLHVPGTNNYVTVDGAVHHNSGKSSGCIMELLNLANLQAPQQDGIKRARFAIIRNTYVELKDTTIRTVLEWMPEPEFGKFHWTDHNYPVIGIPGIEMELMFRALDRPEQVKNLLSLELTAAWVNEAKEIPWAIIEALTGRVGRYPSRNRGGCNYPCIIMDTNPPDDSTWWYKKFEEERGTPAYQDRVLYKQPSGLSPDAENVRNLPPRYYERLASNMSTEAAKVYVHGEYGFLVDGKPVYGDYVDSIHCTEFADPTRVDRLYRGWDFGLTPACVLSALVEGQWRTFHEFVADGSASLDFRTFAEGVLDEQDRLYPWIRQSKIPIDDIGDPSGVARSAASAASDEATCFDIAAGLGISMQGGDQSLKLRIDSISYALKQIRAGKPLFLLHPRCKMLRRGYQGKYQYRRLKVAGIDNRYHELPDKNEYSHCADAHQYIGARLFGGLLKSQDERNKDWKRPVKYPKLSIK